MYRYGGRMSRALILALLIAALCSGTAAEADSARQPAAYTVRYRFSTAVPRGARTIELPDALEGVLAGALVTPSQSDYSAEGYIWSGWHAEGKPDTAMIVGNTDRLMLDSVTPAPDSAPSVRDMPTPVPDMPAPVADTTEPKIGQTGAAGSLSPDFIMPGHDVTLVGGWTADTSALSIAPLSGWYTGKPQALQISGMTAYDAAYVKLGDAPWVTMPGGRAELLHATDGVMDVGARVERDGVIIWEAYTTAELRPRPLVFEVESQAFVYDGKPHYITALLQAPQDENGGLIRGENIKLRLQAQCEQTLCTGGAVAVSAASVNPYIVSPDTKLTDYAITVLSGSIEIKPRPVTLTAPSGRFYYDATEHELLATDVKATGFLGDVSGFAVELAAGSAARRAPGLQQTELDLATLRLIPSDKSPTASADELLKQYDVTQAGGTLEVAVSSRKARVNVSAPKLELVYDGLEHTAAELGYIAEGLPEGLRLVGVELSGGGTLAGKYTLSAGGKPRVLDTAVAPEADVTTAFDVRLYGGQLTIARRPAFIAVQSQSLPYDGEVHSLAAIVEGIADADILSYALKDGDRRDAGVSKATVDIDSLSIVSRLTGEDRLNEYSLTLVGGELAIEPSEVECAVEHLLETDSGFELGATTRVAGMSGDALDARALSQPFEGYALWEAEQSGESFDIGSFARLYYRRQHALSYQISGAIPEGAEQSLPEAVYGLYAGDAVQLDAARREVEGYIWSGWRARWGDTELAPVEGGIVMPRGDVTVVGEWIPDTSGLELVGIDSTYTGETRYVAVNGILSGDEAYIDQNGELLPLYDVPFRDAIDTAVAVCVVRGGEVIWTDEARVLIRRRELQIDISEAVYVYCAAAQKPEATLAPAGVGFVSGEGAHIALNESAARTFVTGGAEAVGADCVELTFNEGTSADNYELHIAEGSITILPRPVTLVMPVISREYDGQRAQVALADIAFGEEGGFLSDVAAWSADFADGADARSAPGAQRVSLQLSTLALTPSPGFEGADLSAQYAISQHEGAIAIYEREGALTVALRALPQSFIYDGLSHIIAPDDATAYAVEGLPMGTRLTGAGASAEGRIAGEYTIQIVGEPRLWDGAVDVTRCYNVISEGATMTIEPSPLSIALESAAFYYSGAQRYVNWEARGVAPSDILEPAITGNGQTEVGEYDVTVDAAALRVYTADDAHEDVTACYTLESVENGHISILPIMCQYTVRCALGADEVRDETLWALNDGAPLDIAALSLSRQFEGYAYSHADPAATVVKGDGSIVITLYYSKLLTLDYAYAGFVPQGAPPVPQSLDGLTAGEQVPIDAEPRETAGYRWSGWRADTATGAMLADGTIVMPNADVTLTGEWSPITDGLSVSPIDDYYTGMSYALKVEGALQNDRIYLTLDGERRVMAGGEALFTDACDKTATVEVERDGAVIWSSEARVRIKPRKLVYAVVSERREYDAKPHAPIIANNTPDDWAGGYGAAGEQAITVEAGESAVFTYVTEGAAKIGADRLSIEYLNGAKPENYSLEVAAGTLEIVPRPVTLIAPSAAVAYDATTHALRAEDVSVAEGAGFLEDVSGFTVAFAQGENGESLGERRLPGRQEVAPDLRTLKLIPAAGYESVPLDKQYTVTAANGTLSVERVSGAIPLSITAQSQSRMYDGQSGAPDTYGYDATGLPDDVTLGGIKTVSDGLRAGVYDIRIEGEPTLLDISSGTPVDVSDCFLPALNGGALTITKRPIRFVAGDVVCKYNGRPHEALWATDGGAGAGGLAGSDAAHVSLSSDSRTEVGVSEVYINGATITNDGADVTDCYELIGAVSGSITVEPVQTSYTVYYFYDGQQDFGASQPGFGQLNEVIASCEGKRHKGMRLASVEGLPLTLTNNPARNIISLYYETLPKLSVGGGRKASGGWLCAE